MTQNEAITTEVVTLASSLTVSVSQEIVEQNTGYLPWVLGDNLAGLVDAYVSEHGLGYYPALDYFRDIPQAVDPFLLSLIDEIAIFSAEYARRELHHRLVSAFASVKIGQIHCTAYTMPRVRPNRSGAPNELAMHFSPDTLKVELLLDVVHEEAAESLETLVLNRLSKWGREPFARFRANTAQRL